MSVNLKRARLVEFNSRGSGELLAVVRHDRTESFDICAIAGRPATRPNFYTEDDLHAYGTNIKVLAEFPLTIAELMPKGCTRFECADDLGSVRMARRQESGKWAIAGHHPLPDLISLQERYKLNPRTFIPLAVHPQYVEERR